MRWYTESPEFKRNLQLAMKITFLPVLLPLTLLTGGKKRKSGKRRKKIFF